jgi:hypothetical protein
MPGTMPGAPSWSVFWQLLAFLFFAVPLTKHGLANECCLTCGDTPSSPGEAVILEGTEMAPGDL